MTSSICHRFVQNAWKKERCSNCFKSKEEHVTLKREPPVTKRSLQSSKCQSIIKTTSTSTRQKRIVSFKPDLTEIIGFGGEEWSENEDTDNEESSIETDEDSIFLTDEDKDLEKLTKSNTEHNANILATNNDARRRTFTQLMLGQPQKDSEGKKQTLLVSVTPFGQEDSNRIPPKRLIKSHIPIAKNKEILVETKPKVILTAYSKNRDSPDLVNSAQKQTEKKELKEVDIKAVDTTPVRRQTKIESVTKIQEMVECKADNDEQYSNDFGDNSYEKIDSDECAEIVETVNETKLTNSNVSVTIEDKNVDVEDVPVLENVKSDLQVQLSLPEDVEQEVIKEVNESSEESADSLSPSPAESREQAGEPDGRADPDVLCEPPALPRSPPPPLVTPPPRTSFLHGGIQKSITDKPKVPLKPEKANHPMISRNPSSELPPLPSPLNQQDLLKLSNKRRAPNPPPTSLEEYQISSDIVNQESILETPLHQYNHNHVQEVEIEISSPGPEPLPRKLNMTNENCIVEKTEEKRKDKSKSKFSLMRFLRVGGSGHRFLEKHRLEDNKEKISPMPKPRLVIVHPLELNGSSVEVVTPITSEDVSSPIREGFPPAPPPRNLIEKRTEDLKPPPKSEELLRKQRQQTPTSPTRTSPNTDNVYANLGEVRSGLVPSKPQRTASMREREALLDQQQIRRKITQENVYEKINPPRRHSDESNNNNKEPVKFKNGIYTGSEPDLELYSPCGSYYGSECELSEGGCSRPCRLRSRKGRSIFHKNLEDNYGAVVVANHEALAQVLEQLHLTSVVQPALRGLQTAPVLRWSDFSIVESSPGVIVGRRGFYHALWGAHHVTLSISKDQGSMHKHPVGLGAFTLYPVTEFNDLVSTKFVPGGNSVDEFGDLIQASVAVLPWLQVETIQTFGAAIKAKNGSSSEINRDACFILLQFVNSLKSLQAQGIEEVSLSLSNFILCHDIDKDTHYRLCLLQGFSEEVYRLEEKEKLGSLCQCATAALEELFPPTKLAILIKTLLKKESAMSLSQVKSILEFSLWGPSDVALGVPIKDRELALQRWLDLERATVLHGLVGTRVQLSVLEECHLLFLVRSSAKMMCEASLLLESNNVS